MKKIFRSRKSIFLIVLGVLVVLFYIAGVVLTNYLETKLATKLDSIGVNARSIHINLIGRAVTLDNVEWHPHDIGQKVSPHHDVILKSISVSGIGLWNLLINKKIKINSIELDSGHIWYDQKKIPLDTTSEKKPLPYHDFFVRNIEFNKINVQLRSDTIVDFAGHLTCRLRAARVLLDSGKVSRYGLKSLTIALKNIDVSPATGMYGLHLNNFSYDSEKELMVFDSATLIPHYRRLEFAHVFGRQTDRIDLTVPRVAIKGLNYSKLFDSAIVARTVEIDSFALHTFRDKRVAFANPYMPLPMEAFLKLPFHVKIDSLHVIDAQVTVEEVPEKGGEVNSIKVPFEKINGLLVGLNNRIEKGDPKSATLYATGLVLGKGKIDATFKLPQDGSPTYRTTGTVKDLPLASLNPILEKVAELKAESGVLNMLAFDFIYTDDISTGEVIIDYKDLHIVGLNDSKNSINEVKTWLINLFVKKDKTRSLDQPKRTGEINFERDKQRFIFNLWWKSIFDGLKSTLI